VTTFHLIRHATNDLVGNTIAGWHPGVHLNPEGKRQAQRLAERLRQSHIQRLYSSPLERTRETALPIAEQLGLELHLSPEIGELQFGEWTGKRFTELEMDPRWQEWNVFRNQHRIPGGETMLELQVRFVGFLQRLCADFPGECIGLVSHGDPIRSALLYYLGMPLDSFHRLEISPASVSVLAIGDDGAQILSLNQVSEP
jgi:broad specificity phosphatase PhoE